MANCSENQIDINSASAVQLDTLYGIGEVKADAIIKARPFNCVDDLIKVTGIGEITLGKINEQGLACVEREEKEREREYLENEVYQEDVIKKENLSEPSKKVKKQVVDTTNEVIVLEPKVIKSEDVNEKLDKGNYAIYGFAGFCILLGFLLITNKNNLKKNEFR